MNLHILLLITVISTGSSVTNILIKINVVTRALLLSLSLLSHMSQLSHKIEGGAPAVVGAS